MPAGDRLLLEGLLTVTVGISIAFVIQGRIIDSSDDLPDSARRWLSWADIAAVWLLGLLATIEIAAILDYLEAGRRLADGQRDELFAIPAALAAWTVFVAVLRRTLPSLWSRGDRPWAIHRVDRSTIVVLAVTGLVGLGAVPAATRVATDTQLFLAALGLSVGCAAVVAISANAVLAQGPRRQRKAIQRAMHAGELRPVRWHLLGAAEPEIALGGYTRNGGEVVLLTEEQAVELAAATRWAQRNCSRVSEGLLATDVKWVWRTTTLVVRRPGESDHVSRPTWRADHLYEVPVFLARLDLDGDADAREPANAACVVATRSPEPDNASAAVRVARVAREFAWSVVNRLRP